MIRWLMKLVTCDHAHTFRERRDVGGVQVLHLICERCWYAVPAIDRTPDEHAAIVQAGSIKPPTIRPRTIEAPVPDEPTAAERARAREAKRPIDIHTRTRR